MKLKVLQIMQLHTDERYVGFYPLGSNQVLKENNNRDISIYIYVKMAKQFHFLLGRGKEGTIHHIGI